MEFKLDNCLVRTAQPPDRDDLLLVARGIWGGSDYLPKVIDRWLNEPWFLVCEYQGKAIACLKMTLFPDNVLWFEGLRVQTKYQNKGIATLMNRHIFKIAEQLRKENSALTYEFCTYFQNAESLHLTQKLGFRIMQKFYVLDKRGIKATLPPQILPDMDLRAFHNFPDYIPCAWQSVHNSPHSAAYLSEHGSLFQTPNAKYYIGGLHERYITLLEPPTSSFRKDLPYFQHFFGSRKQYGIIMPVTFKSSLELLMRTGFFFWDKEPAENMLILRMKG